MSKSTGSAILLFLACIAIAIFYIIAVVNDEPSVVDQQDTSSSSNLRRLSLIDPKSVEMREVMDITTNDDESSLPTLHFYIKSSGQPKYLDRSKRIANSWGRTLKYNDGMTFLLDHHNTEEVKKFEQEHPYISVRQIDGTDRVGEYKAEFKGGDLNAAHLAQRIKMREVFIEYAKLNDPKPDWVCYFDDDMDAQVAVLKEDLVRLKPSCSPNCWIGDGFHGFASGAWCMQKELTERVGTLLDTNTDQDLKWLTTDDNGFRGNVMKPIGVDNIVSSENWYSEFHRPIAADDPHDGYKKINERLTHDDVIRHSAPWTKDGSFMEKWFPTAAVFNTAYSYDPQVA